MFSWRLVEPQAQVGDIGAHSSQVIPALNVGPFPVSWCALQISDLAPILLEAARTIPVTGDRQ